MQTCTHPLILQTASGSPSQTVMVKCSKRLSGRSSRPLAHPRARGHLKPPQQHHARWPFLATRVKPAHADFSLPFCSCPAIRPVPVACNRAKQHRLRWRPPCLLLERSHLTSSPHSRHDFSKANNSIASTALSDCRETRTARASRG